MTEHNSDIWKDVAGRTVYTVPEMYFDTLPEQIMAHIRLQEQLSDNKSTAYQVPDGYFNTLASQIISRARQQDTNAAITNNEVYNELQEVAPFLSSIPKKDVYSIPDNYFADLTVPAITATRPQAKVISLARRAHRWLTYTSAAAVALVIATTTYIFTGTTESSSSSAGNTQNVDVKKAVSVLSEAEIVNYLSANPSVNDIPAPANGVSPEIQHVVSGISEEEISQYLKDNSDPGEGVAKGI